MKIITKIKVEINLHTKGTLKSTSKRHLYSYKTLKNSIKILKKLSFLSNISNLSHIYQFSSIYYGHFEAYFSSIFHSTKSNILLLDPSSSESYDVSFASHETIENISTFMGFTKNSHLKGEVILKIDRLKCPISLICNKKKQKAFLQK